MCRYHEIALHYARAGASLSLVARNQDTWPMADVRDVKRATEVVAATGLL